MKDLLLETLKRLLELATIDGDAILEEMQGGSDFLRANPYPAAYGRLLGLIAVIRIELNVLVTSEEKTQA